MNTDEWLAVVIGFFIGVVVAVKVLVWLAMKAAKVVSHWIMNHM